MSDLTEEEKRVVDKEKVLKQLDELLTKHDYKLVSFDGIERTSDPKIYMASVSISRNYTTYNLKLPILR